MISSSDEFSIFPGDHSKFSLKCTRCGKCVTYPESIGLTLSMAPYAILFHLDIVHSNEDEDDASDQLETLPILFTSHKNYEESFGSFSESLKLGFDSVSVLCYWLQVKHTERLAVEIYHNLVILC